MITDQPTDSTTSTATALTAAASMYQFLIEYPQFAAQPIHWNIDESGYVKASAPYLHPDSERIVADLAAVLHGEVRGCRVDSSDGRAAVQLICFGANYDGARWSVHGYLPVDPFTRFTDTHNPDPQEWTEQERAEYAALATGQAAAA